MLSKETIQLMTTNSGAISRFKFIIDACVNNGTNCTSNLEYDVAQKDIEAGAEYVRLNVVTDCQWNRVNFKGFETTHLAPTKSTIAYIYVPYENIKAMYVYVPTEK